MVLTSEQVKRMRQVAEGTDLLCDFFDTIDHKDKRLAYWKDQIATEVKRADWHTCRTDALSNENEQLKRAIRVQKRALELLAAQFSGWRVGDEIDAMQTDWSKAWWAWWGKGGGADALKECDAMTKEREAVVTEELRLRYADQAEREEAP